MSTGFDWITDEEAESRPSPERDDHTRPESRRWQSSLVVVGILVLAVAGGYAALSAQANRALAASREDVRATHRLLVRAADEGDRELFASLVSGRDSEWRVGQMQLFDQGLVFSRQAMGFSGDNADVNGAAVAFSPDMQQAEISARHAYTLTQADGRTETVMLQHTAVYRQWRGRWLLSRPDTLFWGSQVRAEAQFLTLSYHQRDASLALDLLRDLNSAVAMICGRPAVVPCPPDLRLHLELATDPTSLIKTADVTRLLHGNLALTLPTPTLAGRPLDAIGYQALLAGYKTSVLGTLMAHLNGWQCCVHQRYYTARLDQALRDYGLRLWQEGIVEYDAAAAPLALPEQDVQLLCTGRVRGGADLFRYDLSTGAWTHELNVGGYYVSMMPLPADDGVMVRYQPVFYGETQPRTELWQAGEPLLNFPDLFYGLADPSGQRLLLYSHSGDWRPFRRSVIGYRFRLFDRAACDDGRCNSVELPGFPTWSPDGSQMIVLARDTFLLRGKGDGSVLAPAATGRLPFWFDNNTYGYVRTVEGVEEIVITQIGRRPETLLRAADVSTNLPEANRAPRLAFDYVGLSPVDADLMLIVASLPSGGGQNSPHHTYVMTYDRAAGDSQLRLQFEHEGSVSRPEFSPDGRWLALTAFTTGGAEQSLYLHNLEQRQTFVTKGIASIALPNFDWSADGRWLLFVDDGVLTLLAPDYNYRHVVIPDEPGCAYAAWINR